MHVWTRRATPMRCRRVHYLKKKSFCDHQRRLSISLSKANVLRQHCRKHTILLLLLPLYKTHKLTDSKRGLPAYPSNSIPSRRCRPLPLPLQRSAGTSSARSSIGRYVRCLRSSSSSSMHAAASIACSAPAPASPSVTGYSLSLGSIPFHAIPRLPRPLPMHMHVPSYESVSFLWIPHCLA